MSRRLDALRGRLRPRSIRSWFALAFGAYVGLAALNVAAFQWSARRRDRVFRELRAAIDRHAVLTETRAALEDHFKRVKVESDLFGVEGSHLDRAERARIVASIEALRRRVASPAFGEGRGRTPLQARTDSLAVSWKTFYARQSDDPAGAISELVLTAEPLAQRLLTHEMPAAITAQRARVERASVDYERTDRSSSRLTWAILALSGALGVWLSYRLSRDILRAVAALKVGVERFGAGELGFRVQVLACDELEEVGASLNAMAGRLHVARGELEERNAELARLAFRDPLTTLANRTLFRERVEHALVSGSRRPEEVAVLFIDLDEFKGVNDTLGHAAGDRLLVDVAARLLSATRGSDTVARLGGDEFAILLDSVRSVDDSIIVAQRALAAFHTPFTLAGKTVHVAISVGIACGRGGESTDELLRNADVAMYRAKSRGKGRFEVFAPEMHAELLDRVEMEEALRRAVDAGELRLAFQPIVDLETRAVHGFEALVRWQHPQRGWVPPSVFIPLAEDSGTIHGIGRWVLREACAEAAAWQPNGPAAPPVSVSVNVSGRQLDDASLVTDVATALATTGLPPHCLTLEITEGVIMRDSAASLARLSELKALGVRIAIDDFGTGYSSLAYLQRFPVDVLKIDKAFVDSIARGGNDAALARTIVTLGETLGLRTVAEGIETADQHDELRLLGCELGQGYLYARPMPAEQARAFLAAQAAPAAAAAVDRGRVAA
jgi:diguanylate cyclase (GGDEF)-like protein